MISASTSHVGLVRKENQDALQYLTTKYGDLFVVCDGVGGLPNGALASQTAVDSIIKGFSTAIGDTTELQLLDAMPSKLTNEMNDFVSSYENRRLDAEEFASEGADILAQGGT